MAETVWLSVAPQEPGLTAWFQMEDRTAPELERTKSAMFHRGGWHLDPNLLPQRASEDEGRKIKRMSNLFKLNGFLCVTEKVAAVLRQFDLGTGGLYPLELVRYDGVTPIDGFFWALNFGEKKNALDIERCRNIRGHTQHGFRPESTVKDEDIAVTRPALDGSDIWGDIQFRDSFFVSPRLGQALHKAGLAKVFHLMRCRIV